MALYYTPTSCGSSSFISAFAAGVKLQSELVDLHGTRKTTSGKDFNTINPKGNVPALVLEDGTLLAENVATLLYIADQAPGKVAPAPGTSGYYATVHHLAWTASELHQSFASLFRPSESEDVNKAGREKNAAKLKYLNDVVLAGGKKFIIGDKFSVVDAYTGVVLGWAAYVKLDLSPYSNVAAYLEHFNALPVVQDARARIATSPQTTI